MYPDDFAAFGGISAIRQRGLRIPEDISVAGYDGIQSARNLEPQLATVRQDTEQIGCVAARELISLIERPKTTLIEQLIISGWVEEGKSVASIPGEKQQAFMPDGTGYPGGVKINATAKNSTKKGRKKE